jgi:hypothetical protein
LFGDNLTLTSFLLIGNKFYNQIKLRFFNSPQI